MKQDPAPRREMSGQVPRPVRPDSINPRHACCMQSSPNQSRNALIATLQWSDLEKAPDFKAKVQERKIKVHYLPADGSEAPHHEVNGTDESTILESSPPSQFTPRGGQFDAPARAVDVESPQKVYV